MNKAVSVFILLAAAVGFALLIREGDAPAEPARRTTRTLVRAVPPRHPLGAGQGTPVSGIALEIGSSAGRTFSPPIRVNVTPSAGQSLRITVDGPFSIRPVGSDTVLHAASGLKSAPVAAAETGLRIGQETFPVGRLEIIPESSPAVWLNDRQYRGTLRLFRRANGSVVAVNVLPLEDYLASVVDSEMPAAFPEAARRAQAIVARTYALYQVQRSRGHPRFDLYASTRSQKYLGTQYRDAAGRRLAGETAAGRRAARATRGMVCLHDGRLFCTYYGATCGGRTLRGTEMFADAAEPLQSVPCTWCRDAPRYRWKSELDRSEFAAQIQNHFRAQGQTFGQLRSIRRVNPASASELPLFQVSDGRSQKQLSTEELRRQFPSTGIHSNRFSVQLLPEKVLIEGRGHGHGVGLCQWGARGLAQAGRNALQIIRHYYPGADVVILEASGR